MLSLKLTYGWTRFLEPPFQMFRKEDIGTGANLARPTNSIIYFTRCSSTLAIMSDASGYLQVRNSFGFLQEAPRCFRWKETERRNFGNYIVGN